MNLKTILIAAVFLMVGVAGTFLYVSFSDPGPVPQGSLPAQPVLVGSVQPAPQAAPAPSGRRVVVNDTPLDASTIAQLEASYKTRIADGEYWYDARSGAWGQRGGPVAGYLQPNLPLGGPLSPSASGRSGTGVFVNGRELHATDIANLNALLAPYGSRTMPGRYWVDASGNFGLEGQGVLGNLMQMVQGLRRGGGGGNSFYYKSSGSDYTTFGSGGGFGYFNSKNSQGTSSVYTNEDGSVDIYYEPKNPTE